MGDLEYITLVDFANLAGRGEAGWQRMLVLENVCHFQKWEGPTLRLGIRVSERRRELLVARTDAKFAREKDRREKRLRRYEEEVEGKHDKAVRNRTIQAIEWLVKLGLILKTGGRRGVKLTTGRGVGLVKVKGALPHISIPREVMEAMRDTEKNRDKPKNSEKKEAVTPRKRHFGDHGMVVETGHQNCPNRAPEVVQTGHHDGVKSATFGHLLAHETTVNTGFANRAGYISTRSLTGYLLSSTKVSESTRPPAALNFSLDNSLAARMALLDGTPTPDHEQPDYWLNTPGVPPYPSYGVINAFVAVPSPPHVTDGLDQAARVELLARAYRAATRAAFTRVDDRWCPPKGKTRSRGWWPPLPRPPKPGSTPTPAAIRLLESAAELAKRSLSPHVWCAHRVGAWLEIQQNSLDKPPPVRYVYDPALIRRQGGWARGLSDSYAPARKDPAPTAKKLGRMWRDMAWAFQVERVSSAAQAREVANRYFPPGTFDAMVVTARNEATAMTNLVGQSIAEGMWVWT